jgi:exopolysaccharide production protein ExoY
MVYQVDSETGVGPAVHRVDAQAKAPSRFRAVPLSKRLFDLSLAGFALVFFAPFLLLVTLLILLVDGGPVVFSHRRVGLGGREFGCLKFRTMCRDADARLAELLATDPEARAEWEASRKLRRDPRLHVLGDFLRKTSLDELPQLLNVIRGDMSIVGPRPVVRDEGAYYGRHFDVYMAVRPGITGLWQVSGRSDTTYDERVALDVEYVRTRSFFGDLAIVARTVGVLLSREGAR